MRVERIKVVLSFAYEKHCLAFGDEGARFCKGLIKGKQMKSGTKSMYIRTIILFVVFVMIAVFLGGRLFKLQIVDYDRYLGKVLDNLMQVKDMVMGNQVTIRDITMDLQVEMQG